MPLIKLFANLRKLGGVNEISIRGASVGEVLNELARQKPDLAAYLLENGHLRRHVIVTINGNPTTNENAPVSEQDELAIFPPIAGG